VRQAPVTLTAPLLQCDKRQLIRVFANVKPWMTGPQTHLVVFYKTVSLLLALAALVASLLLLARAIKVTLTLSWPAPSR
jgi:hypothetical protein